MEAFCWLRPPSDGLTSFLPSHPSPPPTTTTYDKVTTTHSTVTTNNLQIPKAERKKLEKAQGRPLVFVEP